VYSNAAACPNVVRIFITSREQNSSGWETSIVLDLTVNIERGRIVSKSNSQTRQTKNFFSSWLIVAVSGPNFYKEEFYYTRGLLKQEMFQLCRKNAFIFSKFTQWQCRWSFDELEYIVLIHWNIAPFRDLNPRSSCLEADAMTTTYVHMSRRQGKLLILS
jgi:hypothetical protein